VEEVGGGSEDGKLAHGGNECSSQPQVFRWHLEAEDEKRERASKREGE